MRIIPAERLLSRPPRARHLPIDKLPKDQREAVLQALIYQERRRTEATQVYLTGLALEKIKREKVYEKLGFSCFEAYCKSTFQFGASHARDYIRLGKELAGYAQRGELLGKVFGIEHLKLIGRTDSPYQELMIEHGSGLSTAVLEAARAAGAACGEDTGRGEQVVREILLDPQNAHKTLARLLAELAEEAGPSEKLDRPATDEDPVEAAEELLRAVIQLVDGGELDRGRLGELSEERRRQVWRRAEAAREALGRLLLRLDSRDPPRDVAGDGAPTQDEDEGEGGLVEAEDGGEAGQPAPAGQPAGVEPDPGRPEMSAPSEPERVDAGQPATIEPDPGQAETPAVGEPDPVDAGQSALGDAGQPAALQPDPDQEEVPAALQSDPVDAGRPAPAQDPALAPLVVDEPMLAFLQLLGRTFRERLAPYFRGIWQQKCFNTLRGHAGLWEPCHLEGQWEHCHRPGEPDPGLDPALWQRYCAAVLSPDDRVRFAHVLPAMLAARMPGSTLHLHMLVHACMPEDMKRIIIEESDRRPLYDVDPALLASTDEGAKEAAKLIYDVKVSKFLIEELKRAMDKGLYPEPRPEVCRDIMVAAVEAENAALAMAKRLNLPVPSLRR